MLGRELVDLFARSGDVVFAPSHTEISLTSRVMMSQVFEEFQPHVVVNAAAYTNVDGAEGDQTRAWEVNANAVRRLSAYSLNLGFRLIHTSTASVFSGTQGEVFGIYSPPSPINIYNTTKAQGERFCEDALTSGANVAWVRTYWLYGPKRKSFVDFVVERLSNIQQVSVVSDQWGQPTYAPDLAARMREIADDTSLVGPVHGVNSGKASRLDWAMAIADILGLDADLISPVVASDFGALAPRPAACLLQDSGEIHGLTTMRPWREALKEYLAITY